MNNIFSSLDASLVSYFAANNIKESDFFCRECDNLMIDVNEIKSLIYHSHTKSGKPVKNPCVMFPHARTPYVESELNRWCINGRNLSGKLFFRHLCWSCFFRKLKDTEDIARKARKSKWYAKILNGIDVVPPAWASPSPYYKLLFDITDDELNAERAKFDTASLLSFIRRKGEVEGKLAYEAYRQRQAYTCSKEYMSKTRGWSEDDWNKFNASRASTEENFLKRYGEEEGRRKWKEYCANEAYAGCSLSYFIEKYGKELGTEKYIELANKKMFKLKTYSNVSQELFQILDKQLGKIAKNSRWEKKNFEYELFLDIDGVKKISKVDYYLNGKVIEFNGDFWHANPLLYTSTDLLPRFNETKVYAKDVWQKDAKRKEALEKLGYKVKVVWEKDFYEDQEKVIEDCLDFLKA